MPALRENFDGHDQLLVLAHADYDAAQDEAFLKCNNINHDSMLGRVELYRRDPDLKLPR